jgi:hypothetical protein
LVLLNVRSEHVLWYVYPLFKRHFSVFQRTLIIPPRKWCGQAGQRQNGRLSGDLCDR